MTPPSKPLESMPRTPAPERGFWGSFGLAVLVHGLLFALLFVGVSWHRQPPVAVQAELWTAPPPAPVVPPPEPAPRPEPVVEPPKPVPAPTPAAPLPDNKPDIALEKKREREKQEKEKQERDRQEARKAEQLKAEQEKREQEKRKLAERKEAEKKEAEKKEADRKAAAEKREQERLADRKAADQRAQQQRETDLQRLMAQAGEPRQGNSATAGAARGANAGGTSGAADGAWAAKLSGMIRANTTYQIPADLAGNPRAIFVVSVLPDCSVAGVFLKRSSGHAGWDQAAERAIRRTDPMPRQPDGKCPTELEIAHGPRDERP